MLSFPSSHPPCHLNLELPPSPKARARSNQPAPQPSTYSPPIGGTLIVCEQPCNHPKARIVFFPLRLFFFFKKDSWTNDNGEEKKGTLLYFHHCINQSIRVRYNPKRYHKISESPLLHYYKVWSAADAFKKEKRIGWRKKKIPKDNGQKYPMKNIQAG